MKTTKLRLAKQTVKSLRVRSNVKTGPASVTAPCTELGATNAGETSREAPCSSPVTDAAIKL